MENVERVPYDNWAEAELRAELRADLLPDATLDAVRDHRGQDIPGCYRRKPATTGDDPQ